jgi:cytochrome c-type biogenesis protein CcmH
MKSQLMERLFAGFLLLLILLSVPASGFAALTETEVVESLICYACPGEPLSVGNCSGGDQMRAAIRKMIAEGKSEEEILGYFVAQFGEDILTTVPKKGFNMVAYAGPFIGLLVGIPVALLIIRRWGSTSRQESADEAGGVAQKTLDAEMTRQVEEELSRLDEED